MPIFLKIFEHFKKTLMVTHDRTDMRIGNNYSHCSNTYALNLLKVFLDSLVVQWLLFARQLLSHGTISEKGGLCKGHGLICA
jgi:hypothetical protein